MSWENKRFVANLSSVGFQSPVPPEGRVQWIDCVKKSKFPCSIHCGVSSPFWHWCPHNALCVYAMVRLGCPTPGAWMAVYLYWWVLRMITLHLNQHYDHCVSLFERPSTLKVKWWHVEVPIFAMEWPASSGLHVKWIDMTHPEDLQAFIFTSQLKMIEQCQIGAF